MNIDLPVFKRTALKKYFYYFLSFNVLVVLASLLLVAIASDSLPYKDLLSANTGIILIAWMLVSFGIGAKNKRDLKQVVKTEGFAEQVKKYERYYKTRLLCNAFVIVIPALLFILTERNLYFYFMIFQLLLSVAFYPAKRIIAKELKNEEIMFV